MTKTKWAMAIITIAIFGWDAQLMLNSRAGDTISEVVRDSKLVTFFVGFLCGHWFWPVEAK